MSSIPNNYEINVAKKRRPDDPYGIHWCTIQLPSMTFSDEAEEKLQFLRNLFGNDFKVTMTYWKCEGTSEEEWR